MALRYPVFFNKEKNTEDQILTDLFASYGKECKVVGFRTEYEGCVLQTRERNWRDDSDFEALVWDESRSKLKWVGYSTTRCWTYLNSATVDATPEVIEKAQKFLEAEIYSGLVAQDKGRVDEPKELVKGDAVKFHKKVRYKDKKNGGKVIAVEAGETGEVIWYGFFGTFYRNGYNQRTRSSARAGVRLADGRVVFCAATKLGLDKPYTDEEDLGQRAKGYAMSEAALWAEMAEGAKGK